MVFGGGGDKGGVGVRGITPIVCYISMLHTRIVRSRLSYAKLTLYRKLNKTLQRLKCGQCVA